MESAMLRRLRQELWQAPRPHGDIRRERTVGPLELFYDLVVVVLVAQAAHRLTQHLTGRGIGEFATVFALVWIAWFNGTTLHDLHGREDVRSRNAFLGQILLLVPLGAFISGAGAEHGTAFAITAALLFALIAFLWWRVSRADRAEFARPTYLYVTITVALAAGLAASVPLTPDGRLIMWAALSVLYLAGVTGTFATIPGRFEATFTVTDALNERFGLLVIIVLGETVTGVVSGLTTDPTNGNRLAVGIVCVLVGFGAWWTYFDFVGHRSPRPSRESTTIWLLTNLPVTAAIAAMGATMPELIAHATEHRAAPAPTWLICGGAATVLVCTIVLMATLKDWRSAPRVYRPLAVASGVAAIVALGIGAIRPAPLLLCILLVLTFSAPWTFAILRRAALQVEEGDDVDTG